MQLKDYIQGDRRGKDANRLERAAMSDPFLQEALDGFDSVAGNHVQMIEQLEKKFIQPAIIPHRGRKLFLYWSAAASVLLLVGFGLYFFLGRTENTTSAIAMLQPDETDQEIADISSTSESARMEESLQEMLAVSRARQQSIPAPKKQLKSLELDEVMDVVEADMIVADAIVSTEIAVEERVIESSAKVMAMKEQELPTIHEETKEEEIVVMGYGTQKRSAVTGPAPDASKSDAAPRSFGEKEFQDFCQQNGKKNICSGNNVSMRVIFFIDETGKPTKIEFRNFSCEEAKKEMENLLSSSPAWTKTNRKVTMTIRW